MTLRPPPNPVPATFAGRSAARRHQTPGPPARALPRHHSTGLARPATLRLALRKLASKPITPPRSATLRTAGSLPSYLRSDVLRPPWPRSATGSSCLTQRSIEWSFDERTEAFSSTRKEDSIAAEQRLDGIYVIRTNLSEVVRAYKSLARVERAFRSLKTVTLKVRPIYHWRECRVRAHLFVCLLVYYLEWHLRRRLAPLLVTEEGEPEAGASPVAGAQRSPAAKRKDRTRLAGPRNSRVASGSCQVWSAAQRRTAVMAAVE